MNGSATLEGYQPDMDATIVTKLLDAGATIVGKAHCENFAFHAVAIPIQQDLAIIRIKWVIWRGDLLQEVLY